MLMFLFGITNKTSLIYLIRKKINGNMSELKYMHNNILVKILHHGNISNKDD